MEKSYSRPKSFFSRDNKNFVRILLVLGLGIVVVLAYSTSRMYTSCSRLSCLKLPNETVLKLTEVYEEVRGSVYRARYDAGNVIVRVDVRSDIDPDASTDYIQGRVAGMKALYDNIRSPYPGLLSNEIVCDEGFKPTYRAYVSSKSVQMQGIIGYLNNRLTFGSCQKDQAVYRGMMVLFTCRSTRQLYQLEFITKTESFNATDLEKIINNLNCR